MSSLNQDSSDPLLPPPVVSQPEDNQSSSLISKMGISLSTARYLAPASFVFDFLCQQYGMNISKPDMKQVHDANPCAFSPQPYAIAGFFGPQQIVQLLWLRELWRPDSQVEKGTVAYVPWYALGNTCIGIWMLFWNNSDFKNSNILVTINSLTQLYYVYALRNKSPNTYQSQLTNIVNITFAGIGILDLFHNGTVAYFPGMAPNNLVKIATAVAAPLTALVSPLLMSACVAYDLFGVALGQHQLAAKAMVGLGGGGGEGWARLLAGLGVGVAAITGVRAFNGAQWL